jgi:hypothetical protein
VSKHPKSSSKLIQLYFPFRGQKNPSAEHRFLLGISDSSFRGAKLTNFAPVVNRLFSRPNASRRADKSINIETSCKSFFNYFSMPPNNQPKAHETRLIPIPARSIHPRPSRDNGPTRVKKSSAPLHENVSRSFPQRPKCSPETK